MQCRWFDAQLLKFVTYFTCNWRLHINKIYFRLCILLFFLYFSYQKWFCICLSCSSLNWVDAKWMKSVIFFFVRLQLKLCLVICLRNFSFEVRSLWSRRWLNFFSQRKCLTRNLLTYCHQYENEISRLNKNIFVFFFFQNELTSLNLNRILFCFCCFKPMVLKPKYIHKAK